MKQMTVTAERAAAGAKYDLLAPAVLERSREFYKDPENERDFLEWKAGKEAKR